MTKTIIYNCDECGKEINNVWSLRLEGWAHHSMIYRIRKDHLCEKCAEMIYNQIKAVIK